MNTERKITLIPQPQTHPTDLTALLTEDLVTLQTPFLTTVIFTYLLFISLSCLSSLHSFWCVCVGSAALFQCFSVRVRIFRAALPLWYLDTETSQRITSPMSPKNLYETKTTAAVPKAVLDEDSQGCFLMLLCSECTTQCSAVRCYCCCCY